MFTATGADIRTFLLNAQSAVITLAVDYGVHSMRFPPSQWFTVPQQASICITASTCPVHYFVAVTPLGACVRCNIPAFLFNLVASHTGLSF